MTLVCGDQANEFDRKEQVDKEPIWRVLLHNDDVHTFDYVIDTIVSVVRTVTRKKVFSFSYVSIFQQILFSLLWDGLAGTPDHDGGAQERACHRHHHLEAACS